MKIQKYIKSARRPIKSSVRWDDDNYIVETFEEYGNGEFYVTDKSNPRNVKTFYSEKDAIQWAKNKSLEKIKSSRRITSSQEPLYWGDEHDQRGVNMYTREEYIEKYGEEPPEWKRVTETETDLWNSRRITSGLDPYLCCPNCGEPELFENIKEHNIKCYNCGNTISYDELKNLKKYVSPHSKITSARYIATDPESGEVLGSADTYEEAVNEWGEDVTITDSEAAEGQEDMDSVFQSRKITSAYGGNTWHCRFYDEYDTLFTAISKDKGKTFTIVDDDSFSIIAKEDYGLNPNQTITKDYIDEVSLAYEITMTSSRKITSAVDGGWEVRSSDVPEALDLFVEYFGEEDALEEIAKAMGDNVLQENIEWIAQQWGFGEEIEGLDVWEQYETAKEYMGVSELFNNLTQAAGYDELAEDLAFIFRMNDFREWDKYDNEDSDDYDEEIESSFNSKHLMSRFAALSNEGQEYVLSQMNCDNEEELEDKIYSYADLYANKNAQLLISNAEREVYEDVNTTPKKIVSSILDGSLTEEKAVQQIASNYDCNTGYARQILNSWISENKEDLIASGAIVNDYNKPFDRDGTLDTWYAEYVPESGPANTVGGELVRAFQSMDIAYYNNGDMIGCGYGKHTVNPSARFIMNNADLSVNKQINSWLSNKEKATPDTYLTFLESARTELEDFLRNNEELFHTPNNSFIGSAAEDGDMRITECYVEDGDGNDYFFRKVGDNEWECTGVDFSAENQEWNEGDTFTDDDEISNEVDPSEDWGSFEKDGITYEWNAIDDVDEDNRHHEWEISMKVIYDQFCAEDDILSDDDLDPDNLDGLTLRDMNGNEIDEREFLASALGHIYQ